MSDLIDRQALLKQIDIDSDGEPGYYGDTWKFIDTIKSMPNVRDFQKDADTISRQAAIDDIWTVSPLAHLDREWIDRWLRQLPPANTSEIPNSSDTISRAKAIDALRKMQTYKLFSGDDMLLIDQAGAQTELMLLPPAQPERIRGRWTMDNACSECGCQPWFSGDIHNYNFCPNCGADMRGEQK